MRHLRVVDDDFDVRPILKLGLEQEKDVRASAVSTVDEAWKVLNHDRPDAAVVDALLNGSSGLMLVCQIAELGIPVLVITGDPATQRLLEALECPFLAKPFRLDELRRKTRATLDDMTHNLHLLGTLKNRLAKSMAALGDTLAESREIRRISLANRAERDKRETSDC